MSTPVHIAWLRLGDLRLRDNPALWHASQVGANTLPIFTWFPAEDRIYACSGQEELRRRDWSYEGTTLQALAAIALANLDASLHTNYKNRLQILSEAVSDRSSAQALLDVVVEVGAVEVHYNRREEPAERRREAEFEALCRRAGIRVKRHSAFLFRDPERCPIFEAIGNGLHVFKAFWDGWHKGGKIRSALPPPDQCRVLPSRSSSLPFGGSADLAWPFGGVVPTSRVTGHMLSDDIKNLADLWDLSESGAHAALAEFQKREGGLARYKGSITRDAGPKAKESRLSPFFRLGLLSMVEVWCQTERNSEQAKKWFRRCAWRDYAYWMLHHWSDLPEVPMRPAFQKQEWAAGWQDPSVVAWQQGMTGYPLVDAAMRELRKTGYLQQNMRHTVGQFLVEVIGADWRDGEEWFHLALADSDLAINAMMWQHQSLTGVSQFLIGIDGHPVRHARAADPQGDYVRMWVPELSALPREYLHCPWEAPSARLAQAGILLGSTYPHRIVEDVDAARSSFFRRAQECRSQASASCFSADGCDLLTLPKTSGLSKPGIRALTEKCFRGMEPVRSKGKGNGRPNEVNANGSPLAKGKGRGKAGEATHRSPRDNKGSWRSARHAEEKVTEVPAHGVRTVFLSGDASLETKQATDNKSTYYASLQSPTTAPKRRWRACATKATD